MKVLVIGNGAREHALVEAIKQSKKVTKIYIAQGNAGLEECVNIPSYEIHNLLKFAISKKIEWTVVGPELPLSFGISDLFSRFGLKCFGVNQKAAQLESSKSFTKKFLKRNNIPTAEFITISDFSKAITYINKIKYPIVIKANGLAAGKGVYICYNKKDAEIALRELMIEFKFGESGREVIIEEFLKGKEISAFAFSDGDTTLPLIYAQDYKKIFENDLGENTGGMGSYAPVSWISKVLRDKIYNNILKATVDSLKNEGILYQGILYAGLMIDKFDIKVLEFNVRFGDPEAQVILPLLQTDIIDIFEAIYNKKLKTINLKWSKNSAICVVLASKGYPNSYKNSYKISGLKEAVLDESIKIYHAGTKKEKNGNIISDGGRVLSIISVKSTMKEAYKSVYTSVDKIHFKNKYFRKDIGKICL